MNILHQETNQMFKMSRSVSWYTLCWHIEWTAISRVCQVKGQFNLKQIYRTNDRLHSNSNTRNLFWLQKAFDDCLQTIASGKIRKVTRFCLFRSKFNYWKKCQKASSLDWIRTFRGNFVVGWHRSGDLVTRLQWQRNIPYH